MMEVGSCKSRGLPRAIMCERSARGLGTMWCTASPTLTVVVRWLPADQSLPFASWMKSMYPRQLGSESKVSSCHVVRWQAFYSVHPGAVYRSTAELFVPVLRRRAALEPKSKPELRTKKKS